MGSESLPETSVAFSFAYPTSQPDPTFSTPEPAPLPSGTRTRFWLRPTPNIAWPVQRPLQLGQ
jgi:hypothetical protein